MILKGSTINYLGGGAEKISDANFFFLAEAFLKKIFPWKAFLNFFPLNEAFWKLFFSVKADYGINN